MKRKGFKIGYFFPKEDSEDRINVVELPDYKSVRKRRKVNGIIITEDEVIIENKSNNEGEK